MSVEGKLEFHITILEARQNWNLRSLHVTHYSAGPLLISELVFLYQLNRDGSFGAKIGYETWETRAGMRDFTYEEEGFNETEKVLIDTKILNCFFNNVICGLFYTKSF